MSKLGEENKLNNFWTKLIGDAEDFSVRNRTFNFVCIITLILLFVCLVFDVYIKLYLMSAALAFLLLLLGTSYYFSRIRKKYKTSILIFAITSYVILILNFFQNSGVEGPSIILFIVTFLFLLTLSNENKYRLITTIHIVIVVVLLYIEYRYPELVPKTYTSNAEKMLDIAVSYIVALIFFSSLFVYLRNSFNAKRLIADERAIAISAQNKQILAQNQQLEQVNEEKNKLFSIVSHDLKSPLDSIKGYLELLSGNMLNEEEKEKIQEELLIQTKYTSGLLANLMSWAKAQMQGVVVNLAPYNVQKLINEIATNKVPFAARKGIKLTFAIDPTLEIVCDKDMVHIVMRNLINNAIKFTNEGGEVYIKALKKSDKLLVSVSDTGIGIPPEQQAEIFTLKTRSTYGTNQEKGIGLGLMMCKEFVEYQHGEIWFESKLGEGTTFFVSLPLTRL